MSGFVSANACSKTADIKHFSRHFLAHTGVTPGAIVSERVLVIHSAHLQSLPVPGIEPMTSGLQVQPL